MGLSLTACGSKSNNSSTPTPTASSEEKGSTSTDNSKKDFTLRLAWLGSGQDKELLDQSIKPFTDETGISVESIYIPGSWAEYFTKMQTMIAGGDQLDDAFIAIEGRKLFVDLGLAAPMTDFQQANSDEFKETLGDIDPHILDALSVDGVLYGAPTEWNNVVMHFNTQRLKEAGLELPKEGWTKEEFLDYCKKLTTEKNGVKQYALTLPDYYFGAEAWLYNNGAAFMNDDFTKSTINSPESIEVFQLWQDLVHKYGYAPVPEKNVDAIQQLVNGNVAMGSWGRWPTSNYVTSNFKDVDIQYLPSFKQNQPVIGAAGIFVMKNSKHYDDAARLAFWMTKPTFIEKFYSYGPIPVRKSIADKVIPALGFPKNGEILYGSVGKTKPVHAPAQYPEVEAIFLRAFSDIVVNKADVKSTLDSAAAEMDSVLAANKK
jgi:ABC-type glycerol-3-phosphate transport system substrate-binding protein